MVNLKKLSLITFFLGLGSFSCVRAEFRDIHIQRTNLTDGTISIQNHGTSVQDLSGFRFCTHDEDNLLRYTNAAGLNGISLEPDESLTIYFNNDAPANTPLHINRSALGGSFATPMDTDGAYAISLYFPPVSFGDGATMADHIQWSTFGLDNTSADERSDEAEAGGLWTDQSQWISVQTDTRSILLKAPNNKVLNSPTDYFVVNALDPEPEISTLALVPNPTRPEETDLTLIWKSVPQALYQIERSNDLSNWTPIPDLIPAHGNTSSFTILNTTLEKEFFRIRSPD